MRFPKADGHSGEDAGSHPEERGDGRCGHIAGPSPLCPGRPPGLEQLTSGLGTSLPLLGGCAEEARAWEGGPHPAHGWVQVVCCGSGLTALSLTLPGGLRARLRGQYTRLLVSKTLPETDVPRWSIPPPRGLAS